MPDISGLGTAVRVLASNTFPIGIELTQFADDSDPIDVPALTIGADAMGLNGDRVSWTPANPIRITLNLISSSEDDKNLALLFEANRAGRNKVSAKDTITLIVSYPDGLFATLINGSCIEFMPTRAIASDSRLKSRAYVFSFENMVTVG